jgi:SAM-dependent methyltransferase
MDIWKFFGITHKDHVLCNPLSLKKIDDLIDVIKLSPKSRIVDIATGKGEFLFRITKRYQASGIGVDLSPFHFNEAKGNASKNVDVQLLNMDGARFAKENSEKFDLASCLGASWIFLGHEGTLKALKEMVKVDGYVVTGEPFWKKDPCSEYLKNSDLKKESFSTHDENVRIGEALGLTCIYTVASDLNDWDTYESLQWKAAFNYIRENPDDFDNVELATKVRGNKYAYLKYGRECLGWAVYVFRNQKLAT